MPSEQDSQPKPAKRARTSFTAEQLQVQGLAASGRVWAGPRSGRGLEDLLTPPLCPTRGWRGGAVAAWGRGLRAGASDWAGALATSAGSCLTALRRLAGYAGAVRAGQQPRRADAAEACGHDGPQPKGHPGGAGVGGAFGYGAGPRGLGAGSRARSRAAEPRVGEHTWPPFLRWRRGSPAWGPAAARPAFFREAEAAEAVVPGVVSKLPSAS